MHNITVRELLTVADRGLDIETGSVRDSEGRLAISAHVSFDIGEKGNRIYFLVLEFKTEGEI